jgi:hypothetical protein
MRRSFRFPRPTCRSYLEKYRPIISLSAVDILPAVKCLNFEVVIVQNTNQSTSKTFAQYVWPSLLGVPTTRHESKTDQGGCSLNSLNCDSCVGGNSKTAPQTDIYIPSLEVIFPSSTSIKARTHTQTPPPLSLFVLKPIHFPHRELMPSTELLLPTLTSFSRCESQSQ